MTDFIDKFNTSSQRYADFYTQINQLVVRQDVSQQDKISFCKNWVNDSNLFTVNDWQLRTVVENKIDMFHEIYFDAGFLFACIHRASSSFGYEQKNMREAVILSLFDPRGASSHRGTPHGRTLETLTDKEVIPDNTIFWQKYVSIHGNYYSDSYGQMVRDLETHEPRMSITVSPSPDANIVYMYLETVSGMRGQFSDILTREFPPQMLLPKSTGKSGIYLGEDLRW